MFQSKRKSADNQMLTWLWENKIKLLEQISLKIFQTQSSFRDKLLTNRSLNSNALSKRSRESKIFRWTLRKKPLMLSQLPLMKLSRRKNLPLRVVLTLTNHTLTASMLLLIGKSSQRTFLTLPGTSLEEWGHFGPKVIEKMLLIGNLCLNFCSSMDFINLRFNQ